MYTWKFFEERGSLGTLEICRDYQGIVGVSTQDSIGTVLNNFNLGLRGSRAAANLALA